jgi:hypothetical protein
VRVIAGRLEVTVATPLDNEGFISTTEDVPEKLLAVVQADGVSAQEPAHPRHQVSMGRFQHQVKVVSPQAVRKHLPAGPLATLSQRLEQLLTINLIE